MPAGRPTTYTPELGQYVCDIISTHACGLNKLTKMYERFPDKSTIYAWMHANSEFSNQYLIARQKQATVLADAMLDIVEQIPTLEDKEGNERIDSGMLGKAKLEYEVLKWHASKMAPKIYGDKKIDDDKASLSETLTKIQSMVNEFNKTNESDI